MKCCICGRTINGFGNNPYPLCNKDDNSSKCCDACNSIVVHARQLISKAINNEDYFKLSPNELQNQLNDKTIVIFYSNESNQPIDTYLDFGRFLAGSISTEEAITNRRIYGTWGKFALDLENDNYCVLDE